mgnify:FL=1
MRGAKKLSNDVRNSAASARSLVRSHEQDDANTQKYLQVIASLHKEWDELEAQGSSSVMPRRSLMDAIVAETRHGSQVEMPETDLGPYSMSEFSLRALIRKTIDAVPGARALRSSMTHTPTSKEHRGLGVPETISCRISAHIRVDNLPFLAQQVGDAIRAACLENLGVSPIVNIHIEDLHDDD